jgi:ribosomal protein S18 acetylase RimI-like enzyme
MSQPAPTPPFQRVYEPLVASDDRFGSVALLPWDAELFGFSVAEYRFGNMGVIRENRVAWQDGIRQWAKRRGVSLLSCSAEPTDRTAAGLLCSAGFIVIDTSLQATLPRLQKIDLPAASLSLRFMQRGDMAEVERIAGSAFHFGRYHTDPFFPEALASRRYVRWVQNAFGNPEPGAQMLILGEPGQVRGFFHFVVRDELGDMRLAAIDPSIAGSGLGYEMYLNVLHTMRNCGVRRVTAKISAANTAVLGLYTLLGFRFLNPKNTFHWHASDAKAWVEPLPIVGNSR